MTPADCTTNAPAQEHRCSHCGFSLDGYAWSALRHYGTHTAHQEDTCLRLMEAELERLRAEAVVMRRWISVALMPLESVAALEDFEDGGDAMQGLISAGRALAAPSTCIGSDPACPCQDGLTCHYKDADGTKAWPIPADCATNAPPGVGTVLP